MHPSSRIQSEVPCIPGAFSFFGLRPANPDSSWSSGCGVHAALALLKRSGASCSGPISVVDESAAGSCRVGGAATCRALVLLVRVFFFAVHGGATGFVCPVVTCHRRGRG